VAKTQQFCTFFLEDQFFGVPVEQVQEVIRYQEMTRVPLMPPVIRGLINLRGQIVMAIDLRRRIGMRDRPDSELPMNVVVCTNDGAVSFLVDEIGDVVEVDEMAAEAPPHTLDAETRALIMDVYKLDQGLMHVLHTEKACDLLEGGSQPIPADRPSPREMRVPGDSSPGSRDSTHSSPVS
jgi:purine-binding chemotaxis protein CheW